MSMHLITYDVNRPGQNYTLLYQAIKSYGTYWRCMQNAWVIRTSNSAVQVRDHLGKYIDANEKLFITKVTEAAWSGFDNEGSNWLSRQAA